MLSRSGKPAQEKCREGWHTKQDSGAGNSGQDQKDLPDKVLEGGFAALAPHAAQLAFLCNHAIKQNESHSAVHINQHTPDHRDRDNCDHQ